MGGNLGTFCCGRATRGKTCPHGKNGRLSGTWRGQSKLGGGVEWASFRPSEVMAVCPDIDPEACVTAL